MLTKWRANQKIAIILFVFSVGYLIMSFQIPNFSIPRPIDSDLFPKVLGFLMAFLSIVLFFEKDKGEEESLLDDSEDMGEQPEETKEVSYWKKPQTQIVVTLLILIVYVSLFELAGFVLSTLGLLFFLTLYYGYRRHVVNAVVSVVVSFGFYLLMTKGLGVYLPAGWLPL
ncbi:tripartite tricarboxylate transporter TctB family protein [Halalkalibacter alkalisediminis]|uniref:Tripartite tricarboxylate transporter TctB family protein n=1 Tax=Halalkalibacter alkalisediminis TaxID=935616 RepID=A0ABV6NLZ8_9BACI|nr:tripartite tricarboxylate transporter TctB family protein [Halalkalibacter alkalisediminis]